MYLCKSSYIWKHAPEDSYITHNLHIRSNRADCAGSTRIRALGVGFRLHTRNRRSGEPYVHGKERQRPAAGHPRRGDHVRLHGARIFEATNPPGRETRSHGRPTTDQPIRATFDRELWVYSSDRKRIATLTIRGQVIPRPKSIEEQYPVDAGGGLRLSSTLCAFTYMYPGERMQSVIGYANTSQHEIRLELRPEVASGLLSVDYPQTIAPGARGQINLGYLIPADRPRYGTIRDAMQVFVDGRSRDVRIVTHGIGADNPARMPEGRAPRCEISENILKFGPVKHNAPRATVAVRPLEYGTRRTRRPIGGERRPRHRDAPPRHDGFSRAGGRSRGGARPGPPAVRRDERLPDHRDERPRAAHAPHPCDSDHRGVKKEKRHTTKR